MEHRLVPAPDVLPRPWRNGGGVTRELLAWPIADEWRIRVSVADISSGGPFSSYPGVERWMAILEGAGVDLTIDGRVMALRAGDAPLRFSGGSSVHCRLIEGPVRDLNLMLRGVRGAMQPAIAGEEWIPPAGAAAGFFGTTRGRCAGIDTPRHALLWFSIPPPAMTFTTGPQPAGPAGWWLTAATGESAP